MVDKAKRDQINTLKTAEVSNNLIVEQLKKSRKTDINVWKQFLRDRHKLW